MESTFTKTKLITGSIANTHKKKKFFKYKC